MQPQALYLAGFIGFVVVLVIILLLRGKKKSSTGCNNDTGVCTANMLHTPAGKPAKKMTAWCKRAERTLKKVIQQLGSPDSIVGKAGGMAVWSDPKATCLDRVEVRDSTSNSNYLYVYLNLDLPAHLETEVRKLADGVQYNTSARQLVINCRDMEAATVIAVVAKRMVTGQLRSEDARSLVQPWILEVRNSRDKKGDMEAYDYELCKYKNSLSLDYMNALACVPTAGLPCGVCSY